MLNDHLRLNGVLKGGLNADQRGAWDGIAEKIRSGVYKMERPICPTCGNADFEALTDKDRYGLDYNVVACRECGLFQVSPRLDEASLADFYANHYRMLYGGKATVEAVRSQAAERRGLMALELSSAQVVIAPGARIVEIGCGAGAQLNPFQTAGCSVVGYDYDERFMELGRKAFGLDLRPGGVEALARDVADGDPRPDVMLYIHVLEHLSDPRRELARLAELLKPGGVLYVEVPGMMSCLRNRECYFDEYFEFAHNYHFDQKTLVELAEACGWRVLWSDNYVRAVLAPREMGDYRATVLGTIAASEEARTLSQAASSDVDPSRLVGAMLRGGAKHAQAYFHVGERLFNAKDERAVDYLARAHALEPDRGKYAFLLARAMILSGEAEQEALLRVLETSARLIPDAAAPKFHLGNVLEAMGRSEEAIGAYAAAIRLQPDMALQHYRLGLSYKSIRHWSAAQASLEKARRLDPSLTYAFYHEGEALRMQRRFEEAAMAFSKAYELKPEALFATARDRCWEEAGAK